MGVEGGVAEDFAELEEFEEGGHAGGFGVEAVGGDACGDGGAGVGAAGGDDVDFRVEAADDGEELEAGHARHIEVGEEDVGDAGADEGEGCEAIFSGADGEASEGKDLSEQEAGVGFVFNDQ